MAPEHTPRRTNVTAWRPWLLGALLALGTAAGWRLDGASSALDANPPTTLSSSNTSWRTRLGDWSNASPVKVGNTLLVTAEPTTLIALDATTGAVRWKGRHDYIDTLQGEARTAFEGRVAGRPSLEAALKQVKTDLNTARQQARSSSPPPDVQSRIAALGQVVGALTQQLDQVDQFLTPPNLQIIGYASSTPATDGQVVVAVFGHGVVGCWTLDGRRLWIRWLGTPYRPMKGYDTGSTASPSIVDGVAIVAYHNLYGLDLRTGDTIWKGDLWPHFGSPEPMNVGGTNVLLTPNGDVLRTRDGVKLTQGLGDLWYVGPTVKDNMAFYVGNYGDGYTQGNIWGKGWRLQSDGAGGVSAIPLWTQHIEMPDAVYAAPAYDGDHLYVTSRFGAVRVLDARTGAITSSADIRDKMTHSLYANPVVAGPFVIYASEGGRFLWSNRGADFSEASFVTLDETFRSTVLPEGDMLYVRQRTDIVAYHR